MATRRKKTGKRPAAASEQPAAAASAKTMDPALAALMLLSVLLLSLRWYAARKVGFGDSEALYACYAQFPQPAYLDHPGFVGLLMRALAGEAAPTPYGIHTTTAVLATALPWVVVVIARRLGAGERASIVAGLITAVVPEVAVGLFALTPDLPLAFLWLSSIGFAAAAFEAKPGSPRAASYFLGAGLLAGAAASDKATGALLFPALAFSYVTMPGDARAHRKSPMPWLGLVVGAVVVVPILYFEKNGGWPMLRHRLVDTQHEAGFSLRNLGAVLGGQLVYLSPLVAWLAVKVGRDLFKRRNDDGASALLFWSFALPSVALVTLSLWSRVAEPHWLAPPLLALVLHGARATRPESPPPWSETLVRWSALSAAALTLAVHAWVLSPAAAALWPKNVDTRADIAAELFGWPEVFRATDEAIGEQLVGDANAGRDVWIVGPHWVICAQLKAGMPRAQVGCAKDGADFDGWAPRERWMRADTLVYVNDARFDDAEHAPERLFPGFAQSTSQRVSVMRGGRVARRFRIVVLSRRAPA